MREAVSPLPPVLLPGATAATRRWMAGLVASGRIRKVGPRLYASVPDRQVAAAVRASWSTIVAGLFPRALLSHRSALEFTPTTEGEIFLTSNTNRVVAYPGLRLRFLRGPGPQPDDPPFLTFHTSSLARALLENLSARAADPRCLPLAELEARLDRVLTVEGEAGLNQLRDRARELARDVGWTDAGVRLDTLIGTLLGTRSGTLTNPKVQARHAGEPFSAACLARLTILAGELRAPLPDALDPHTTTDHVANKAFFEAYFSNYIEGTTFEIEEAEAIIFDRELPATRPLDAHDILGTHRVVADRHEMRRTPATFDELVELLRARHATMLAKRPEAAPGTFKVRSNRAGDTQFVEPEAVVGTLRKGWELYRDLPAGLPRAIFMMFLVTDVHPFVDGNGRVARMMMNAELVATGRSTIIIPTVFRDDYLQALRALTRRHRAAPLVRAMMKAQRFSTLPFAPYPSALADLQRRNWFREPDDARILD
jgi:Fic/DOC family